MKKLFILFALLIFACLSIFFYSWYRLHTELHYHGLAGKEKPEDQNLSYNKVSFLTSDNVRLAGWYVPAKNPKAVVILVHGRKVTNAGKSNGVGYAKFLHDAGYSSLLFDLRSNGESPGNQVTLGAKEWRDVEAAYDYVKSLPENNGKKIGYLGVSMGAATTIVSVGETHKGDFVIASVPYANFKDLFALQLRLVGLYPPLFLPFVRAAALFELGPDYENYMPDRLIKNIHVPILLIQASQDKEVPIQGIKDLYDEANPPKEFWTANAPHDIFIYIPDEFKKHVLDFLNKYVADQ